VRTRRSSSIIRHSLFAAGLLLAARATAVDFWLSPPGRDSGKNPPETNRLTIAASLQQAAELRRLGKISKAEPVRIILHGGRYPLIGPLSLSPEASSAEGGPLIIEAAPGEHPVLSGGVVIGNWEKVAAKIPGLPETAHANLWVADAPKLEGHTLEFRQLWVDGTKAIRARKPDANNLTRLVAWDKTGQTAVIPADSLVGIKDPARLEMIVDQVWEIAMLRVDSIRYRGTNALLTFKAPEGKLEFLHPWPPVIVNTNYHAPFFLANAIQFMDEPGEWFEDLSAGKVFYWPRAGEDLTKAEVIVPALETLVQVGGTPDRPATNIQFKGIAFEHTTWLRPSGQGHVPLQAGMFMLKAGKLSPRGTSYQPKLDNVAWLGRPPSAVSVIDADHLSFLNCSFEHLASAGLDFPSGAHDALVQGCTFLDIGGNGLQLGKFSDPNVETHTPYNPADQREICSRGTIANNLITDCGNEDWGCVGIGIGYAQNIAIEHNEIFNLPYTAISVGWGWTKTTNALRDNLILANHIHHVGRRLGDLGGIYLMSAQPGTIVARNSISDLSPGPYVPDPQHWFYLYLDEGSSGITVSNNWCPSEKFLKNANGPGNVWTNNGPQVSETIRTAAGLTPAFQSLLIPDPLTTK